MFNLSTLSVTDEGYFLRTKLDIYIFANEVKGSERSCVCVCVYIYIYVCVCVCVISKKVYEFNERETIQE
jgi:hypothetical protein